MNVLYENRGRVAVVTINRPEVRNAVDSTTAQALADAFRRFESDDAADVGVLYGAGGSFCAGADLKALAAGDRREMTHEGDGPMGPTRMQLSKPVIAAIEGYAVAGGLELALWCDMRVLGRGATMGVFCRRFGVPLIDLGTVRLPRLIGQSRAMDMILTGRAVDADEALSFGLANRVVPRGEALDVAVEIGEAIAAFPTTCMRHDRQSAIAQWSLSEADAMRLEFELGIKTVESGETVAGAGAFAGGEGRHGVFPGGSKGSS